MNRHKSLERLRSSITSALNLCSQLETGRQDLAHRVRGVRSGCNDVSHVVKSLKNIKNQSETPSALKRQTEGLHLFQPAQQDGIACSQHRGRLIPHGTSDPFVLPPSQSETLTSRNASRQAMNENTNYGSLISRPCPFSPNRTCPRQGPCPYAGAASNVSGAFDTTRRPCPYSPTNYCSRNGPCPYMPLPSPQPVVDDMVCPFVARMADAISHHPPHISPPPPQPSMGLSSMSCARCTHLKSPPPVDNRCYSPTVCPLDPRPCIMSPRPCPFKQADSSQGLFASGCPYVSGMSSARLRSYSEPRRCPYSSYVM